MMMKIAIYALTLIVMQPLFAAAQDSDAFNRAKLSPEALVRILQSNDRSKLLILNLGPRVLYAQAHITGAEYIGPASDPHGIELLRERVKVVPKGHAIILYCGCCPWDRCPNIRPAFAELKKLGFSKVQVLFIANNIGADWVDKGYPTTRGER